MKEKNVQQKHDYRKEIANLAHTDLNSLYLRFGSTPQGMPEWQVESNRARYGLNTIFKKERQPWYFFLFRSTRNPFNFVLLILALVALVTRNYEGTVMITAMVFLSVGIKFREELRSARTEESLKKLVSTKALVIRPDTTATSVTHVSELPRTEIPLEELVPGDLIYVSAGDMIPADVRIIHAKTLFVNQSTLTGESLPVEKQDSLTPHEGPQNETDYENICLMGSTVAIGSATAIVFATGKNSYLGSMADSLSEVRNQTSFDIGINKVSWLLIRLMLVISPLVFLINGLMKGNWLEALLFGLSVAVGLTPEMLPVVVTTNLAKGAIRMSKKKVIVRNLNSIQDLGAMDVLCTDKTGTLTENRIVLIKHLDYQGKESQNVLELAFLNSFYQSGLRNSMDEAVLENKELINKNELEQKHIKLDEIPFDFERRRMSVILEKEHLTHLLVCKGAVDEVMECCTQLSLNNGIVPLDEQYRLKIKKLANALNEDGMRVVVVAHALLPVEHGNSYDPSDEKDLIFDGVVTFLDPPKQSAGKAIRELQQNNIEVKVLTGDNEIIAKKVCQEVGYNVKEVITGPQIADMNDELLSRTIQEYQVFARLTPLQKERIVKLLRKNGRTVGFLGDGINDAPSLAQADIGISVDTAVDIARESAGIILLEQDLTILNAGVEEGRKTYANTIKYIKCTASSNFGNIFSLIGASALFPFLPMLPLQILILNLIYDISQTALPWDNVDEEFLRDPHKWDASDITRFILFIGPISSVFDYLTFFILYKIFGADNDATQATFQTGWFLESLFTQTIIIQLLRTRKIPFIQSMPNKRVLITSGVLLATGLAIPFTWFGRNIGMHPMPAIYFVWMSGVILMYCLSVQFAKRWYINRFKKWL
ncbi:MAG: magnesium-translocating P-type ATPase [Bacteroidales bacterium]